MSNASQSSSQPGQPSHERLEDRSFEEIYELAGQLGIPERDGLTKAELIEAIRRR